jgi:hypothetical protein
MLTPNIIAYFEEFGHLFETPKHTWTRAQIETIYQISNEYYGTNKPVTTCGSCVKNTTEGVRRIYQEYKLNKHGHTI